MSRKRNYSDYIGKKYCRYTVVGIDNNKKTGFCICRCICGVVKSVDLYALLKGKTKSCGCYDRERFLKMITTHGLSNHPLHGKWVAMMGRCYNNKFNTYRFYGAKGVMVCKRWHKYLNFYNDLIKSYEPGMELDRFPNPKGHYKLSNVRWANRKDNMKNIRNAIYLTYCGHTMHISDWAIMYNINADTLYARLYRGGWTIENALTIPGNLFHRTKRK